MSKLEFNFDENNFNKLFPFFIVMDSSLIIKSFGESLAKMCPNLKVSISFSEVFNLSRPNVEIPTYKDIVAAQDQLIIIGFKKDKISLRGQFQIVDNNILFVGSPWFVSMEEVTEKGLTMNDFALNDSLMDLLHVINNYNNSTQELKVLVETINNQKNKLKRDQEELNRLSLVASANENGVVFTKPEGEIFWCNEAYLTLTGFSQEEVLGNTPIQLGKCEETTEEELLKMTVPFLNGDPFNLEHLHLKKNGEKFWVKTKGQPIFDSNGKVAQYFAMIEDITEKKQADFKLMESEDRLLFLIRNLQTGIILEDENRKLLLTNKKSCSMFDYDKDPDELIGMDLSNSVDDSKLMFKNPDIYTERLNSIFKSKQPVYNEELELADGRFFERSYIPIFRDGIYKGCLRYYVDITIKKNHELILQNEKQKYSNIIANMNLGLIEVNLNDEITMANQSFCEISGYSLEELIGSKSSDLLLSEEGKKIVKDKRSIRKKGVSDSYEVKIINNKGEQRYWLISGAPNYNSNGEIVGTIGINLDITDQKEQEERLYLLSLIAEKNINAVVVSDKEGRIEWANTSFEAMSGYSMEEFVGKKPGHFLQGPETKLETINYMRDRIEEGLPFNCEIINYSKSGQKYWVSIQGQALYNKEGEIVRFFAIEENITQKKELEQQKEGLLDSLAQSNKKLEDYAQIVSHDLKSPLRSIHSLITWIKEDNDKIFTDQTLNYFSMMENKVEKMDSLIEGILTYSKIDKEDLSLEKVNTQQIIQSIIAIIHIPKHIKVTIKNELPVIYADRYRIQQLFQNIIGNAVNYIDKEIGSVEISSEEFENHYVFSIKDNGVGIAEKHHKKIFETFQSLTTSEHSTGLGLSIVKKIVEKYNGEIWIESEEGVGSTFFIKLSK